MDRKVCSVGCHKPTDWWLKLILTPEETPDNNQRVLYTVGLCHIVLSMMKLVHFLSHDKNLSFQDIDDIVDGVFIYPHTIGHVEQAYNPRLSAQDEEEELLCKKK